MARIVVASTACALLACASPGSQPIVGPDGSAMAHVHCGSDQGTCFRIAGELCPQGYEIKPVLSGNDGNFLVRCRAAQAVAEAAPRCPPALAAAAAPSGLMYPWPPPAPSVNVKRTPTAASVSPEEIDLGY